MRVILMVAAMLVCASAAEQPDGLPLLKKVAIQYAELSKATYEFELVEVTENSQRGVANSRKTSITGSRGRWRRESMGMLEIFDGQYLWFIDRSGKEYSRIPLTSAPVHGLSEFQYSLPRSKGARVLRQEAVQSNAGPAVCHVVEVLRESNEQPRTYWIDVARLLVLKVQYRNAAPLGDSTTTVSFPRAVVGQPVDEARFRFTPAADAKEVERFTFGRESSLVGQQSPQFELKTPDGTSVPSSGLRGSAVLLHFSREPENESTMLLEMMYRSLKISGLTVWRVLPEAAVPGGGPYSVPVAFDPGGAVAKKFAFDSTGGAVLIDRAGQVAFVGDLPRESQTLAAALRKIGVW